MKAIDKSELFKLYDFIASKYSTFGFKHLNNKNFYYSAFCFYKGYEIINQEIDKPETIGSASSDLAQFLKSMETNKHKFLGFANFALGQYLKSINKKFESIEFFKNSAAILLKANEDKHSPSDDKILYFIASSNFELFTLSKKNKSYYNLASEFYKLTITKAGTNTKLIISCYDFLGKLEIFNNNFWAGLNYIAKINFNTLPEDYDYTDIYNIALNAISKLKDPSAAIYFYNLLLKIKPDDYKIFCNKAAKFMLLNQNDKAVESLEVAEKLCIENFINEDEYKDFLIKKVNILLKINKLDKALETLKKIEKIYVSLKIQNDHLTTILLKQAEIYINLNQPEKAIEVLDYNELLKPNPRNLLLKSNALCKLRKFDEAIEMCDQLISQSKEIKFAYLQKSAIYFNNRQIYESLNCLDELITKFPKDLSIYKHKALILNLTGKFDEAIKCYDKFLEIIPNSISALNEKANLLLNTKYKEELIKTYEAMISLGFKVAPIYYNLGVAYKSLNNYDEAIEYFKQALELDRKLYFAYTGIADTYLQKHETDEAINYLNSALSLKENHSITYNLLGVAAEFKGDYSQAIENYDKAYSLNPKFIGALQNKLNLEKSIRLKSDNPHKTLEFIEHVKNTYDVLSELLEPTDSQSIGGLSGTATNPYTEASSVTAAEQPIYNPEDALTKKSKISDEDLSSIYLDAIYNKLEIGQNEDAINELLSIDKKEILLKLVEANLARKTNSLISNLSKDDSNNIFLIKLFEHYKDKDIFLDLSTLLDEENHSPLFHAINNNAPKNAKLIFNELFSIYLNDIDLDDFKQKKLEPLYKILSEAEPSDIIRDEFRNLIKCLFTKIDKNNNDILHHSILINYDALTTLVINNCEEQLLQNISYLDLALSINASEKIIKNLISFIPDLTNIEGENFLFKLAKEGYFESIKSKFSLLDDETKNKYLSIIDSDDNNILHLISKYAVDEFEIAEVKAFIAELASGNETLLDIKNKLGQSCNDIIDSLYKDDDSTSISIPDLTMPEGLTFSDDDVIKLSEARELIIFEQVDEFNDYLNCFTDELAKIEFLKKLIYFTDCGNEDNIFELIINIAIAEPIIAENLLKIIETTIINPESKKVIDGFDPKLSEWFDFTHSQIETLKTDAGFSYEFYNDDSSTVTSLGESSGSDSDL